MDRPWLKNYPNDIPANIDPDKYKSLLEILDEAFEKYKKRPAYTCMGKTMSYGQIDKYSRQFGAYLHSRGLVPGDKIGLMMPNLLQYPIALYGSLRAGLIVVNTNPLYTSREMKHQFVDSGVKAVIIAENFAYNLEKVINETGIKIVITTSIGELLGFPKKQITNFVVRKLKRMVPRYHIPNQVSFSEAMQQGSKFSIEEYSVNPNDTVILQYTGGTTGIAKGAMLTHRNLIANMLQTKAILSPYLKDAEETVIAPLPLYHIFAFTVNCMAMLNIGAHNILVVNARDLSSVVKVFKKYPISLMLGVNTLFNALLNNEDFTELDFSSLKVTVAGGMALQSSVAEKWQQVTGCYLAEGYGLTETSPVACANPFDRKFGRIGYIGLPVPSTEMRTVDESGNELALGQQGELQIRGPQVMKGYHNRPDETAKVLTPEGWLSTGDMAIIDEEGFVKIVDRKKDLIIVSGFNVYPNEIEEVVAAHPKVLEAAAIGIPDPKSTEVVKLFVVKKDASLTESELSDYCKENLTGYKRPKQIEFRKELPKSNVGKIMRRILKEEEANKK